MIKFASTILISSILFSATFSKSMAQEVLDWKGLQKGSYDIGFIVNHVYDSSRSFGNMDKRPLQISIWYPAIYNFADQKMSYKRYLNFRSSTINFSKIGKDHFTTKPVIKKYGIPGKAIMKARYSAETCPGKYPVILFIPGNNSHPSSYFLICEYLASNGFVVISAPSLGHNKERGSLKSKYTLKARLEDAKFLIKYLKNLPNIDDSKIGLLGHSAGGITMISLASNIGNSIKSIISMDGSEGNVQDPLQLTDTEFLKGIVYKICIAGRKGSSITTWPDLKILSLFEDQNAETVVFNHLGHEDFVASVVYNSDLKKWDDYLRLCRFVSKVFKNQLK